MSEKMNTVTISRRSTRLFVEEQPPMETGNALGGESRHLLVDEKQSERSAREAATSSSNIQVLRMPVVDLGKPLCPIFPNTLEDIEKQVMKSVQAANASAKAKADSRPLNFGVVLPGSIFRSSFPSEADQEFLGSLGLKTILTLVKKDPFPEHLTSFIQSNGIRHFVIEMEGTKKIEISKTIMQSIMKIVLDDSNYPLLIHCNHGKHRTGCAVAVMRHVTGWNVDSVIEEYRAYAEPKAREQDMKYIKEYQVSNLEGLFTDSIHESHNTVLTRPKMARMAIFTVIVMLIMAATALFW